MRLTEKEMMDLEMAVFLLENPGWVAKVSDVVGTPVEKAIGLLPEKVKVLVQGATEEAIKQSLKVASLTIKGKNTKPSKDWFHNILVASSGGVGGFFGLAGLAVELPISTVFMMRSILDIAQSEGADISDFRTRVACIEVFALGGRTQDDNASESGYFATRGLLAKSVSEAMEYIAAHGVVEEGAPALVKLIINVASRFGIQVTEKVAAQSVPVIGAATGAVVNLLFIDHFQDMARGHFIVKRLERAYGESVVQEKYLEIVRSLKHKSAAA